MKVRVCSASLLNTIRQTRLPTIFQTITSLDAPWTSTRQDIALDPVEYSRGSLGHFSTLQMERIKRLFATVGETYRWGTAINPLWAVILEKVEEAWRSAKWTDTRSVFENKNVARLFLEREDTQAPHGTLENMPFSLHSSSIRSLSHEMHDFPDRSGTSVQPPVGTRVGAGAPRASSPRVVSCPTCGTGQMRSSELFV